MRNPTPMERTRELAPPIVVTDLGDGVDLVLQRLAVGVG